MSARSLESKFVPLSEVAALAARLKAQGKKIVTTNGCFDLIHLGHIQYLLEARALGDVLICGVNSDASVKKLKGPKRPVVDEKTRALQVAGLEAIDYVTIFSESTPEKFLSLVHPAIHVKGGDYDPKTLPEKKVVEEGGGKVVCLSLIDGFSTTDLITKLKNS